MNATPKLALCAVLAALLAVDSAAQGGVEGPRRPARPGQGPGYQGTFPTAVGKAALAGLQGADHEDAAGHFGGGTWRIRSGGVTPHPLGPGRGDTLELRSARVKGPHVELRQGRLAVFLPTRCDGDVRALCELLGRKVDAELAAATATSAEWRRAIAAVGGLGPAVDGVRVGLMPVADARAPGQVRVLVWNVGDAAMDWIGQLQLRVGKVAVPVECRWPPHLEQPVDRSRLRLEPGSTFEFAIDPARLLRAAGHGDLADGATRELRIEARRRAVDAVEPGAAVTSAALEAAVGGR